MRMLAAERTNLDSYLWLKPCRWWRGLRETEPYTRSICDVRPCLGESLRGLSLRPECCMEDEMINYCYTWCYSTNINTLMKVNQIQCGQRSLHLGYSTWWMNDWLYYAFQRDPYDLDMRFYILFRCPRWISPCHGETNSDDALEWSLIATHEFPWVWH